MPSTSWSLLPRIGIFVIASSLLGAVYLYRTELLGDHSSSNKSASSGQPAHADMTEAHPETSSEIEFPPDQWSAVGLRVEPVTTATLAESIELTGKIALNEDKLSHVFPLVEGRVDEVRVRFGQRVKADELLVMVQSKEVGQGMLQLFQDRLKLEFAEARARWMQDVARNTLSMIEMMRAEMPIEDIERALKDHTLGDDRVRLTAAYLAHLKATQHLQRLAPLTESGAVPARQKIEMETEVTSTRANLQSLLEQISQDTVQASRLAAQSVKELQTSIAVSATNLKILGFHDADLVDIDPMTHGERLAHYPVKAPFDGTVISKDVVLLERVGPERQILTIADLSTVWVTADIYEAQLPLLAKLSDQTIQLRCDAWPGRQFDARIFYTGDVVQESTRTIALRAIAPNDEGLLKPGMFVTVVLPSLETDDVLQVPATAIQNHDGQAFVFVQTGAGTFARRDIHAGRHNRDAVEIVAGLEPSDRVVVAGGFALKSRMLAELLAE